MSGPWAQATCRHPHLGAAKRKGALLFQVLHLQTQTQKARGLRCVWERHEGWVMSDQASSDVLASTMQ